MDLPLMISFQDIKDSNGFLCSGTIGENKSFESISEESRFEKLTKKMGTMSLRMRGRLRKKKRENIRKYSWRTWRYRHRNNKIIRRRKRVSEKSYHRKRYKISGCQFD